MRDTYGALSVRNLEHPVELEVEVGSNRGQHGLVKFYSFLVINGTSVTEILELF